MLCYALVCLRRFVSFVILCGHGRMPGSIERSPVGLVDVRSLWCAVCTCAVYDTVCFVSCDVEPWRWTVTCLGVAVGVTIVDGHGHGPGSDIGDGCSLSCCFSMQIHYSQCCAFPT